GHHHRRIRQRAGCHRRRLDGGPDRDPGRRLSVFHLQGSAGLRDHDSVPAGQAARHFRRAHRRPGMKMKKSQLLCGLAVLVLAALLPLFMQGYGNRLMNTALISAIAVIGLNFVFGYAGLISLAHAAFVGIAAYIVAILTTAHGWSPWLAALLAIAATCLCAYIAGRILLRLKGHYLA